MRFWLQFNHTDLVFAVSAESNKSEIKIIYPENIQFLMEKLKDGFQKLNPEVSVILQKGAGPDRCSNYTVAMALQTFWFYRMID